MSTIFIFILICCLSSILYGFLSLRLALFFGREPRNSLLEIAEIIRKGAMIYLVKQYLVIILVGISIAIILALLIGYLVSLSFILGAMLSGLSGFLGMKISTRSNARTAEAACFSLREAFSVAIRGGSVIGLLVTSLGLSCVSGFYIILSQNGFDQKSILGMLITLSLGSSFVSIFSRLGGGIFTKGADIGADLVGKIEKGIPEDDPRNPAVIADSVGDNVGDCAGSATEIFETYTLTLVASMLLGLVLSIDSNSSCSSELLVIYPLLIGSVCMVGSVIGIISVQIKTGDKIMIAFYKGLAISCFFSFLMIAGATEYFFGSYVNTSIMIGSITITKFGLLTSSVSGILTTVAITLSSYYYTSTNYGPVLKIVRDSEKGPAINIIRGLAISMEATVIPYLVICSNIIVSYIASGFYGIAVSTVTMLSLSGIIVTFDSYGPIVDNAGGLVRIACLPKSSRFVTDTLDSIGNSSKAITKVYATILAGLSSLILFIVYTSSCNHLFQEMNQTSLQDPYIIIGLCIGSSLPYIFSSLGMKAVISASEVVMTEVHHQLSKENEALKKIRREPDYERIISLLAFVSIRKVILPALLPFFVPFAFYESVHLFTSMRNTYTVLGAMMLGTIITGFPMAISMIIGGGAWDNAKKFIESKFSNYKKLQTYKAAVVGDIVGDPYKDTVGPTINSLIKIISTVVFILYFFI